MELEFKGKVWYWRGPAPFYFVTVPEDHSAAIKSISSLVTYGWGVIPVYVEIGDTKIKTSLFPKDGKYLVPLKSDLRKDEFIELDDVIQIKLEIKL